MADPDVALEAHDDGAVDGGHEADLHQGEDPRQDDGVHPAVVLLDVQARQSVQEAAPHHHRQVVGGQDLQQVMEYLRLALPEGEDGQGQEIDDDPEGRQHQDTKAQVKVHGVLVRQISSIFFRFPPA